MDMEGNEFDIHKPIFCCSSVGWGEDMAGDEAPQVN